MRSVVGLNNVPEARSFNQVTELQIEGEALNHTYGVEGKSLHRPSPLSKRGEGGREGGRLPCFGTVMNKGVVHVVADGADRPQVQGPVAPYAPLRRNRLRDRTPSRHTPLYHIEQAWVTGPGSRARRFTTMQPTARTHQIVLNNGDFNLLKLCPNIVPLRHDFSRRENRLANETEEVKNEQIRQQEQ